LYHTAHPDLHPFPTRRSSDLSPLGASCRVAYAGGMDSQTWMTATTPVDLLRQLPRWTGFLAWLQGRWSLAAQTGPPNRDRGEPRSEEHTSELQSLRHLVCRLL